MKTNGRMPMYTSCSVISGGETLFVTKRFTPNGGLIVPNAMHYK